MANDQGGQPPLSPAQSTFSMTTTISEDLYRYDQGRRFQNSNDVYALPNDDEELERLDIQHRLFMQFLGKLYFGPVEEVVAKREAEGVQPKILDIGTGTGIWAIQIAQQCESAQVTGVDLAPIQPHSAVPSNVHFEVCDVTKDLDLFQPASFDVLHVRCLVIGIQDWPAFIQICLNLLRPGGVLLVVEPDIAAFMDPAMGTGPALRDLWPKFIELWAKRGIDMSLPATIKKLFSEFKTDGSIADTEVQWSNMPLSPWPSDPRLQSIGRMWEVDWHAAIRALITALVRAGHLEAELHDIHSQIRKEFRELRPEIRVVFAWATKP